MGAKSNASTTGKTAQDSKSTTEFEDNVPIAPIPTPRICQGLFLEIPLRLYEHGSCAITCVFHQVMGPHLQRINNSYIFT
jgi:hypothetical protein